MNTIHVSSEFRKTTTKAVLSVGLFFVTYLGLVFLAIALTLFCGWAGLSLIYNYPRFITILLGLGIISCGILILIFLFKFIFKKHNTDLTHLVEITREQEPALFQQIEEIVKEVRTDFPKKVYLSADVNAAVFYDSSFWSMFFPVRKNLQIGVGLMNSTTVSEFKGILAHEFGHFSQRSMKVGSYVYNVNQVIYNMLYENESYTTLAQQWAKFSNYFIPFVVAAMKIVQGIQWILRKVYKVVNLNYMSLSREMEFHADAVAANVVGSQPFVSGLLRLDISEQSLTEAVNFYYNQSETMIPTNVYPQQQYVMHLATTDNKIDIINGLPQVTLQHLTRLKKSKLSLKNQWATHPNTEDRIEAVEKLQISSTTQNNERASTLLHDKENTEKHITKLFFSVDGFESDLIYTGTNEFIEEYTKRFQQNSLPPIYNGYYDHRNPESFDLNQSLTETDIPENNQNLFNDDVLNELNAVMSLQNDIETLKQISGQEYDIKFFQYDGQKYAVEDACSLYGKLEQELAGKETQIRRHEQTIFSYFQSLAEKAGKREKLKEKSDAFFQFNKDLNLRMEEHQKIRNASGFMQYRLGYDVIEEHEEKLAPFEKGFKQQIESLLNIDACQSHITQEMRDNFTKYLSREWKYFFRDEYSGESVEMLYQSMNDYENILSSTFFRLKKELLDFQAVLEISQ